MKFFVLLIFVLAMPCGFSFSIQREAETSSSPLAFQKPQLFTLPDGLTVIVKEDHTAPIATVQAWSATGSIHEGAHLGAGMSHMLEHMLFKGTARRAPGVIAKEVREQGGYVNATTFYDKTIFYIETSSSGVADAIDILADVMIDASLPLVEYSKEQEVIRREIAMRNDNPDEASWKLLYRTMFRVSPFREPVIGDLDIYNQLSRADVITYYKQRYAPNNLCFVVVGDVDAEKIRQQLTTLFQKQQRRSLEPVLVLPEPPQLKRRLGRDTFSTTLSHLKIAWKIPNHLHHDAPALTLLAAILGSGSSSLLNQDVHEQKELVHQIGAGIAQPGILWISATADPQKRNAAEAEILGQVELLKKQGVTVGELEKAKQGLLSQRFHFLATTASRASDYGNGWMLAGDPSFETDYFETMKKVTPAEIKQVAKKYLVEDGITLISVDPKSVGAALAEPSIKQPAAEAHAIQKFILPNGLRLLIHEDHRLPLISMAALFRGGILSEDSKNNGLMDLLTSTITQGTHSKTSAQIAQTLEQVGGDIGANAATDSFGVFVDVMKPDLKRGLDLLAEVLTEATFPSAEVDRKKKTQLAFIKEEQAEGMAVARQLLNKQLFGVHPYGLPTHGTEASVSALTPEMLRVFYQQFVVGRNGVIAIFGDVKTEEVLAMATKAFASMPAGSKALQSTPAITPLTAPLNEQATLAKEQAIIVKGFLSEIITSSDRPALELVSAACSNMGSRFFKQLREKKALVYYVNTSNVMGLASGSFIFYLGADPKKTTIVRQELDDEINKLVAQGITQEELEQAKKKILQSEASHNQANAHFAAWSANDELMGLGYDHCEHRAEEINGVTLEQANHVIRKYLGAPGSIEVVVGPSLAKK